MDRLDGVRPVSEVLAELAIERDAVDQWATAGHVRLGSADRPLEGRGLDEIGLFAYNCDEADDRIKLIDKALSDDAAGRDVESLQSARERNWTLGARGWTNCTARRTVGPQSSTVLNVVCLARRRHGGPVSRI